MELVLISLSMPLTFSACAEFQSLDSTPLLATVQTCSPNLQYRHGMYIMHIPLKLCVITLLYKGRMKMKLHDCFLLTILGNEQIVEAKKDYKPDK